MHSNFHRSDSKDHDVHVLDGWMPATKKTSSMHHPRRRNVVILMVGLKTRSHTQNSHSKWWTPEIELGMQKEKKKILEFSNCLDPCWDCILCNSSMLQWVSFHNSWKTVFKVQRQLVEGEGLYAGTQRQKVLYILLYCVHTFCIPIFLFPSPLLFFVCMWGFFFGGGVFLFLLFCCLKNVHLVLCFSWFPAGSLKSHYHFHGLHQWNVNIFFLCFLP